MVIERYSIYFTESIIKSVQRSGKTGVTVGERLGRDGRRQEVEEKLVHVMMQSGRNEARLSYYFDIVSNGNPSVG